MAINRKKIIRATLFILLLISILAIVAVEYDDYNWERTRIRQLYGINLSRKVKKKKICNHWFPDTYVVTQFKVLKDIDLLKEEVCDKNLYTFISVDSSSVGSKTEISNIDSIYYRHFEQDNIYSDIYICLKDSLVVFKYYVE